MTTAWLILSAIVTANFALTAAMRVAVHIDHYGPYSKQTVHNKGHLAGLSIGMFTLTGLSLGLAFLAGAMI